MKRIITFCISLVLVACNMFAVSCKKPDKDSSEGEYVEGVTDSAESDEGADGFTLNGGHAGREADPLYDRAVQIVLESKRDTPSFVQRRLQIGYNRAANLLEAMEEAGIISKPNPAGKREILVRDGELFQ